MAEANAFPDLDGLLDLARTSGVEIRPTLLRVVTDLFLQRRIGSVDGARHYIILTQRLLDAVGLDARQAAAAKLARDRLVPRQIVLRLARDDIAVAEPVLRHSPCLTTDDLKAIATEKGGAHAAVIAARLAGATEPGEERAAPTEATGGELAELFFRAGPTERRLILLSLDYAADAQATTPAAADAKARGQRFEAAALQHQVDRFAQELADALALSPALARRIVDDASGEPIVAALKALAVPVDVAQRIVLFLNPSVGHSIERVYQLTQLYAEISLRAAQRLVAIWRDGAPRERPAHTATPQRGVLMQRPATVHATPAAMPRRSATGV